jgi:preprotein translocase subunit SecA
MVPAAIKRATSVGWSGLVHRIDALEPRLGKLDESQLRKESLSLKYRAQSGEPLERLLPEAFALVREAAQRSISMRHYPVQLIGGIAIHHGCVAEMQTGEGKTLTATLPMYLASLKGNGAHLATANDYLAARDAMLMKPVYESLGISVGIVESQTPRPQRQIAYAADITYSTAKELGFDFLRDRLLKRDMLEGHNSNIASMLGHGGAAAANEPVQRTLGFALVDEADSILIDEAKTPLIVSSLGSASRSATEALYVWAAKVAPLFQEEKHFKRKNEKRETPLNADGRKLVRSLEKPCGLNEISMIDIYEHVERAILVENEYQRDRHYVIDDGEIVIVDEFTGRLAEGRKWRSGIHQAIEAREGLPVSVETGDAARITLQDFFLRYQRLAGMTGTIANSAAELKKIYRTRVIRVPTNRPPQRKRLADRVFGTQQEKWQAIVQEICEVHQLGRPVLVGTRSIDRSELLAGLLQQAGIAPRVLNARHVAQEAQIVAMAGDPGQVTVATNMAGRGTDIKLADQVRELGGMHVICSEIHESARIDRQLIGRCGRQGDPGSYRIYMALDDDILKQGYGAKRARRWIELGKSSTGKNLGRLARLFHAAQTRVERENFKGRKLLLYHDQQRRKTQRQMGQDPYLDTIE